jgi:hypothetical protein
MAERDPLTTTESLKRIRDILEKEMERLPGSVCPFLFSPEKPGYLDPPTLRKRWEEEWDQRVVPGRGKGLLSKVFTPKEPYTLPLVQELALLDAPILKDFCVRCILQTLEDSSHPPVTPQLILELLNLYHQRPPEFLILVDPLLRIILSERRPAWPQGVKTQACAVLINHFEIENLLLYLSLSPAFPEEKKQILFQSLTAFQKIYRKFLELQEEIGNKDRISLEWFGLDFEELKKKGRFRDSFSNLVGGFIERLRHKDKKQALEIGRFLVLRFNNEDILRVLHAQIGSSDLKDNVLLKGFIFRQIHTIMTDFRRRYISRRVDTDLTRLLSEMERQNQESMRLVTVGRVPAPIILKGQEGRLHLPQPYPPLPELQEKLIQYHLSALFDLYPVPPPAQEILIVLSRIADNLELRREDLVKFIAYLERVLIFLQQLEEMEIEIIKNPRYGILLNPFQMKSLGMIRDGAYFASTGYWMRSTVPPALIRCIQAEAIPNCLGILDRHIFSRISLHTGAFRGTPFDLDSTHRYDWDEEPENCQIRAGYFLLNIPPRLTESWETVQAFQREALKEKIQKKEWQ